jgi:hypothetical protein
MKLIAIFRHVVRLQNDHFNENQPRAKDGKWSKSGGASKKTDDKDANSSKSYATEVPDFANVTTSAPRRISAAQAHKALEKGFAIKDPNGTRVHFGKTLLEHIEGYPDAEERKEHLPWAIAAVRNNKPFSAGNRSYYMASFKSTRKKRGMFVVGLDDTGEALTMFPTTLGYLAREAAASLRGERVGGKKKRPGKNPRP